MKMWKGKIAVITGASSGIGEGLARIFVQKGLQVVGLARRVEIIEKISRELGNCSGVLHPIQADVSKREDIENAFQKIKEKFGEVNILINNAGIARFGSMADGNVDDWKKVLHTNVLGLSIVTKEALKLMKDAPLTPHIVNINSLGGQRIFVGSSMYGASKHALTSLTNVLRHDLKLASRKVRVTSINPGVVNTNILDKDLLSTVPNIRVDHLVEVIVFTLNAPSTVEVQEMTVDHPDMYYSQNNML